MDDFQKSLKYVLREEGGYSNHPKDPGGATNFGVTQRVYDGYRQRSGLPLQPVKQILELEVQEIYRASYWNLAKCDKLPTGVNYVVFDGAVNSGVGQSVKWLQRALNVNADGVIGPATISAAHAANPISLIGDICDQRLRFLQSLKTWSTFGKGWGARVGRVRSVGMTLSAGTVANIPSRFATIPEGDAKAFIQDVKKGPSPATGDALTGAGTMGATVTQTINQLLPLSNVDLVAKVITWLTVVSVLLALGGIAYGMWARWKKAKIKEDAGTAVQA